MIHRKDDPLYEGQRLHRHHTPRLAGTWRRWDPAVSPRCTESSGQFRKKAHGDHTCSRRCSRLPRARRNNHRPRIRVHHGGRDLSRSSSPRRPRCGWMADRGNTEPLRHLRRQLAPTCHRDGRTPRSFGGDRGFLLCPRGAISSITYRPPPHAGALPCPPPPRRRIRRRHRLGGDHARTRCGETLRHRLIRGAPDPFDRGSRSADEAIRFDCARPESARARGARHRSSEGDDHGHPGLGLLAVRVAFHGWLRAGRSPLRAFTLRAGVRHDASASTDASGAQDDERVIAIET